jgi:hypothetical protein
MLTHNPRWSHAPDNTVVPSRWQATSARLLRRASNSRSSSPYFCECRKFVNWTGVTTCSPKEGTAISEWAMIAGSVSQVCGR